MVDVQRENRRLVYVQEDIMFSEKKREEIVGS